MGLHTGRQTGNSSREYNCDIETEKLWSENIFTTYNSEGSDLTIKLSNKISRSNQFFEITFDQRVGNTSNNNKHRVWPKHCCFVLAAQTEQPEYSLWAFVT